MSKAHDEEYRVAAVKDRIATTGQVLMGLTVGCAQCHTHKFDPITHHDYYQFFGVFNQTEDSDREDEAPTKPMPTAAERQKIELLTGEIAQLDQKLGGSWPELETELHEWEAQVSRRFHGSAANNRGDCRERRRVNCFRRLCHPANERGKTLHDSRARRRRVSRAARRIATVVAKTLTQPSEGSAASRSHSSERRPQE